MKWISPVLGFGTWITRFSVDETGRTVGVALAAWGLVAALAVAMSAVGATATMPAAAMPLRATFKKPLRDMSCICHSSLLAPIGPVGGSLVGVQRSTSVLGALRSIRHRSRRRMSVQGSS